MLTNDIVIAKFIAFKHELSGKTPIEDLQHFIKTIGSIYKEKICYDDDDDIILITIEFKKWNQFGIGAEIRQKLQFNKIYSLCIGNNKWEISYEHPVKEIKKQKKIVLKNPYM